MAHNSNSLDVIECKNTSLLNTKSAMPVLRVAHVIGSVVKGGVEFVVFNYYRAIDRNLVQFDFIIDNNSPCEISPDILKLGCSIYKIPSYKNLFSYIKSLTNIFRKNQYKIVHSHMNTLSVFTLLAAKLAGVPIRIAHSHSTAGKGEFFRNVLKYILRPFSRLFATHLFACSEHAGRWLFGNRAFNMGKVTIIRNTIDVLKFQFNSEMRKIIRQELNIVDKFVIGHVGRFTPQKNHSFLLDVFVNVHNMNSDAVLLLIGDGQLKTDIENKVKRLGLEKCVHFLGVRDDIHNLYQAMDMFVLPSRYEGLGLAGVEAQCAGLPCVFSLDVPAEAVTGNFVKSLPLEADLDTWASALLRKLSTDERLNEANVNAKFWNINTEADRLTNIFCRLSS